MQLSQYYVLSTFKYKDGKLYNKVPRPPHGLVGAVAGSIGSHGYLQVSIKRKSFLVHRLIFLMHYGYLPKEVDHINNDRSDNRIENLRAATRSENQQNVILKSNNTSGVKGVSWDKSKRKWVVNIASNNKSYYLGSFDDLELAELVVTEARDVLHAQFSNNG